MAKIFLNLPELVSDLLKVEKLEFTKADICGDVKNITVHSDRIELSVLEAMHLNPTTVYNKTTTISISYEDFMHMKDSSARKSFLLEHLNFPGYNKPESYHPGKFVAKMKLNSTWVFDGAEEYNLDQILHLLENAEDVVVEEGDFN